MNSLSLTLKLNLLIAAPLLILSGCALPPEAAVRSGKLATWSIQYHGEIVPRGKDYHILDLFDCKPADIARVRGSGSKVIAYFSSQYENWRPDSAAFPAADLGNKLDTWEGERWVNTSSPAVRAIMTARMDMAKSLGYAGVDMDNVDFYDHPNGFGLGESAGADYVKFLANAAHQRGLLFGLKNATALIGPTRDVVDYYVNEQAHEYCDLDEYMGVTKPIFCIEYKPLRAAMRNFYTVYKPDMNRIDERETVVPNLP